MKNNIAQLYTDPSVQYTDKSLEVEAEVEVEAEQRKGHQNPPRTKQQNILRN